MVEATKKIDEISPEACRRHVKENFSNRKMAEEYLKLYEDII
jgi:glycosyltransferase involved in cell wall biosynthesis